MKWPFLFVAAAGCVAFDPPRVQRPLGIDDTSCHLAPAYDGKIKWPGLTTFTELTCTTTNEIGEAREVCFQPYVGVRQTGALYTSHDIVCSSELGHGASETFAVRLD